MTITSEQVQKWIRIAIYLAAGAMAQYGWSVSQSTKDTLVGIAVALANALWTLYGSRITAKLNEISKLGVVEHVVVNDPQIAAATDAKVVSTASVKVVPR